MKDIFDRSLSLTQKRQSLCLKQSKRNTVWKQKRKIFWETYTKLIS